LQIAKYAAERLPAEILLDQLDETRDDDQVTYFILGRGEGEGGVNPTLDHPDPSLLG
jgi:hypothetical protein